ncbi:hypothetical protein DER44DRAFT_741124 [Fusarium oxysporum]|nr:hypothetical protein DER44DRAFT_741124 [Fusarium oxysporum]
MTPPSNKFLADPNDPLYTSTKIAPFDQITCISQATINTKLKWDWKTTPELAAFKVSLGDDPADPDYSVDAIMTAPTLYFSLNFKSGTFVYYTGHRNPVKHTPDMTGWRVTFIVSLDHEQLDNPDDVPEEIRKRIELPGSYSIAHLVANFTTAQLSQFVLSESNLGDLDEEGKGSLSICITKYLSYVASHKGNILGYAVTADSTADYPAPTFPPTAVKFQIIPFRDENEKPVASHPSNSIAFLEVTDRKLPNDVLQWSANWLPPTFDGTMTIARANVFDGFFNPRLSMFSWMVLDELNELVNWISSTGNPPTPRTWYLSSDNPISNDEARRKFEQQYPWTPVSSDSTVQYVHTIPQMRNSASEHFPPITDDYSWTTNITNKIICGAPGSNTLTVQVSGTVKLVQTSTRNGRTPSFDTFITYINLTPQYTLSLIPGTKGKLDVEPGVSANSVNVVAADGGIAGWFHKNGEAYNKQLSDSYTQKLQKSLDLSQTLKDIKAAFSLQNSFVFAGNKTFIYKTANFNAEGDLISGLFYND